VTARTTSCSATAPGFFYSWDINGTAILSEGAVPWADPSFKVVTQHWDVP
jgi:hypothetical protein